MVVTVVFNVGFGADLFETFISFSFFGFRSHKMAHSIRHDLNMSNTRYFRSNIPGGGGRERN